MKEFNPTTIKKVIDHLQTNYELELQADNEMFYFDYCNEDETDYFQFIITPEGFHIEGSEADMYVAIEHYAASAFESDEDLIACIDNDLPFYLPKAVMRNYKINQLLNIIGIKKKIG